MGTVDKNWQAESTEPYRISEHYSIEKDGSLQKNLLLLYSAHLGDFAIMIAALIYAGLPVTWIARDANNQYLARFMDRTRRKKGIYGINKENLNQAIAISSQLAEKRKYFVPFDKTSIQAKALKLYF